MFAVLSRMQAHAAYCISGDNTVQGIQKAIQAIVKDEADDYFVIVLSDANLHQYNISTTSIANGICNSLALSMDSRVNSHIVFIGNISDQADRFANDLPRHAYVCLDVKSLPRILKSIFIASMLK